MVCVGREGEAVWCVWGGEGGAVWCVCGEGRVRLCGVCGEGRVGLCGVCVGRGDGVRGGGGWRVGMVNLMKVFSGDAIGPHPAQVHGPQRVGDVSTLDNDPLHYHTSFLVSFDQTGG